MLPDDAFTDRTAFPFPFFPFLTKSRTALTALFSLGGGSGPTDAPPHARGLEYPIPFRRVKRSRIFLKIVIFQVISRVSAHIDLNSRSRIIYAPLGSLQQFIPYFSGISSFAEAVISFIPFCLITFVIFPFV